ncbi:GTPase HflX [Amylibacter sp. IMCC11727]|uniref:GTPase HflX n=1 Tax=Amylibacter sp. IMCC11727 TaxID=3039851 RepID=UPI00244E076B|nr:GTPase HflX [Amylibacter sp. IMCC11727]WGI20352.1 GTPase HflX [Amylibacter sp. IMCC11727]
MERACVLHPDIPNKDTRRAPKHALAEAVSLANALNLDIGFSEVVNLRNPHVGLLFSKGKLAEIGEKLHDHDIGLVIIDGPVTPIQQRNLERHWKVKVLDRTGLILEIFSDRAATREGVLQVDLAALSYSKTRLVRAWTHLERQRGGLGFVGGAGETQIEADRRAIDDAIVRLKKQLAKVVKTRELHRAARAKVPYPIVALVGYTNAGKSTLFNTLTGADVMAKDMLFATLDPTMRELELPEGQKIILSDTVGFISELPTQLVAAFRATLEEVLDADLILHVRDIAHPETQAQADDVTDILNDLGISQKAEETMIEVWNKSDLLDENALETALNTSERTENIHTISAITGQGLDTLLTLIETAIEDPMTTETIRLAYSEGARRAWLFEQNVIDSEGLWDQGYEITVTWTAKQAAQFEKYGS